MCADHSDLERLWPEDLLDAGTSPAEANAGPNTGLAVKLLAAGCTANYIAQECGFSSVKEARAFLRDPDVRQAAREATKERAERVGARALVGLERLLSRLDGRQDLRAVVLALRTGLEAGGVWRKELAPPVKRVEELSVTELNELIEATRRELNSRSVPVGRLPARTQ